MEPITRFGLEFNPFLKNAKEILINTQESREAAFRLDYLAKNRGFGILTGAAGRGKTTAVRRWKASLNPSLYKVIYSSLSTLTVNDFYRSLAGELGALPSANRTILSPYRMKLPALRWKSERRLSSSLMKRIMSAMPS